LAIASIGSDYSTPEQTATIARLSHASTDQADLDGEATGAPPGRPHSREIDTHGLRLRTFASRGVLVNAGFDLSISGLSLIQGFVLAAFLTRSDYGVWGVLAVSLGVLARLKVIGIGDKYIQQQEEQDEELAFQRAFTLDALVTAAALVPLTVALPVIAVVYGHWNLVAPGAVLVTVLAADALQAPFWIYYRRMDFVRQRTLQAIEPLIGFAVTIALAIAGAGYWALVIGVAVGAWAGAITAIVTCPYRLAWRYDRGALRIYASFSGPMIIATACSVVLANATLLATNAHLGLAGAGAVTLAGTITAFTTRVDGLIGSTLYPAICAIQDRVDLLRESFVKANRLALMWAMPFGVALALFAPDLVRFAIGERWQPAVTLLQITGLVAAINHIGFNWDDYFKARGETAPLAVNGVISTVVMLGVGLPLLFTHGLGGLAIGLAAGAGANLLVRAWYLSRLFDGFRFIRHALRAVLPTVPAVAAVLLIRALESGARVPAMPAGELVAYIVVTAGGTLLAEGALLREVLGYVRGR
jgi:O-antigen/teichoic acid export membrane protein